MRWRLEAAASPSKPPRLPARGGFVLALHNQCNPVIQQDTPFEHKTLIAVDRDNSIGMAGKEPREHDARAGAGELAQRHCEPRQRTEQDIGEDQIVAGTRSDCRCPGAGTDREGDPRCNAVKPRIASRRLHRDRINVASDDARPHQ